MKKFWKILLVVLCSILLAVLCFGIYLVTLAAGAQFDDGKLIKNENNADFYTSEGMLLENPDASYTPISEMPEELRAAFIAVEDKNFYRHHGIDYKRMVGATLKNIASFSFREGASTISQQLIKNTHLSGEKTLKRKAAEVKLARTLEKKYTKDQILECYLNTIYFGNGAFGVGAAAQFYFSKKPSELTLNECAMLAAAIKAPAYYSPTSNREKCTARKNTVLRLMHEQGYIDDDAYAEAKTAAAETRLNKNDSPESVYLRLAAEEVQRILAAKALRSLKNGYKIYTYLDRDIQQALILRTDLFDGHDDYAQIVTDNVTGGVAGYVGTVGEIRRSPGSAIKPLLVYGPAVEENAITPLTPLLDEKTNFGGYAPSNYKNRYYGYVSAKFALANSLNIPAVKTLEYIGTERAARQAKLLGLPLEKEDWSLALALGGLTKGLTLRELAGAYQTFASEGTHRATAFIRKITDAEGKTVYEHRAAETQALSAQSAFLMNDMLKETVKSGTLKKLSSLPFDIAGKTGTVGYESGNTDAYAFSYTSEYTMGFWLGKENGGNMTAEATGGGYPALYSRESWSKIYRDRAPAAFPACNGVSEISIDKRIYEENHTLVLAGELLPEKEIIKGFFKIGTEPKDTSDRYSAPKIKSTRLSVINDKISIELCLEEYYDYRVIREISGIRKQIFDSRQAGDKSGFTDSSAKKGKQYTYYAIPYFITANGTEISGPEVRIGSARIAAGTQPPKGDWWQDDFD